MTVEVGCCSAETTSSLRVSVQPYMRQLMPSQQEDALLTLSEFEDRYRNECGAICLAYILRYNGIECTYRDVVSECQITSKGISMFSIRQVAEKRGLYARSIQAPLSFLRTARKPLILLWRATPKTRYGPDMHYVMLLDGGSSDFHILEPLRIVLRRPPQAMKAEEMAKAWTGKCIEFSKTPFSRHFPSY